MNNNRTVFDEIRLISSFLLVDSKKEKKREFPHLYEIKLATVPVLKTSPLNYDESKNDLRIYIYHYLYCHCF